MDKPSEMHLKKIKIQFTDMVDEKYRRGAEEHGGKLWEKTGLVDMAIEEAIDQVVYLLTLKEQIKNGKV